MTGETERNVSGWTVDTLAVHLAALKIGDEKFQAERDRRYAEVDIEREKALRIKEQADRDALGLAREIQSYKDEKANDLRTQIEHERGEYASQGDLKGAVEKLEETLKPIVGYVSAQQGRQGGIGASATVLVGAVSLVLTVIAIASAIYFSSHRATPIVVTTPTVTPTP